ncbi:MAG: aminotransferase class I/II-fold pyridoxal phosphate-dependent enzyme [Acidobacteria bacterium]|nr:aminotransferase class I/II-fold pyridoxal phosphate-dependent enzyme [Acidobacteriota bacterium]
MKPERDDSLPIWGGEERYPLNSLQAPIYQTSSFRFRNIEELRDLAEGRARHYLYTRYTNPTLEWVEKKIAAVEGGASALVFSSGMAAMATALLALLKQGDRLLASSSLYGGTYELVKELLPRFGISVSFFSVKEGPLQGLKLRPRLLLAESPTNPDLQLLPLVETAQAARRNGVLTLIDNTFASPINQRPLHLGWNLVMHSATKFLSGHSDLIAGALIGSAPLIQEIQPFRKIMGGVLDPSTAYLLGRGLKTLYLRVQRQNHNALQLARFLEEHAQVQKVVYPWLESHPQYELARRQMSGGSGVISFYIRGGWEQSRRFFNSLKMIPISTSLGGVESLVTSPYYTSHHALSARERKQAGVTPNLVRMSVGIENADELCADLNQALIASQKVSRSISKSVKTKVVK